MPLPKPQKNPKPEQSKQRAQFLRVANLQGVRQKFKILKVVNESTEYSDFIIRCEMLSTHQVFAWGIKVNSSNYEKLFALYGENENEYVGKFVEIEPEYSNSMEDYVMSVVETIPTAEIETRAPDMSERLTQKTQERTAAARSK